MTLPLLALCCAAAACAHRARHVPPPVETPRRFSEEGSRPLQQRWWRELGDPQLDELVGEALRANLDLRSAWERLRQARALVERESAPLVPGVSAGAQGELNHPSGSARQQLWLGVAAEYEIDLWGRIRSLADAERYRARASEADYQTVALSVSAEVARTWYRAVEARGQLKLIERQVEASARVLRLLEAGVGGGKIRTVDVLRQRRTVEATRELGLAAESRLALLEHQLAVLLGRPPRGRVTPRRTQLPELPPLPAAGLPGELLRRRPDVRRAFNLLLAADRQIAAAVSNRYPRLSLSASVGVGHSSASGLFEDVLLSLAGSLLAPLIDGGRRRAEVDRTRALKRQRLFEYGKVALVAFREVEDALMQEKQQLARVKSLERQAGLARETYRQLRVEYFNGMSDYIDVLTALTREQQLQRDLLAARRAALEHRIALYRALAGGFQRGAPGAAAREGSAEQG